MKLLAVGAAALAATLLYTAVPSRAAEADSQVAQLIAASGKALGVASLASVSTMRIDSKVSAIGLQGTSTQFVNLRDGRLAESTTLSPFVQLDGYDGHVAWSGDGTHLVWNDGGDSDRSSEINQAYILSYGLWKPDAGGATVAWAGTKSANGHTYDALTIAPPGTKVPFELLFDQTTQLPARANFVNSFTTATLAFSDYRPVNGLSFPYAMHTESSDGNNGDAWLRKYVRPARRGNGARAPEHAPDGFLDLGRQELDNRAGELHENHVYLDVMLNGKGPYHFIFDTGGSNVVDGTVAKEIGAIGAGNAQGSGVGAQTESLSFGNVAKLQVGDAVLTNQLFAVAPTRRGFGVSAGRPVDGLIGWEVLARYITTFDYANRQVTLSMPGTTQPPANGHVVPFVLYGTQPQIACVLDGIPAECRSIRARATRSRSCRRSSPRIRRSYPRRSRLPESPASVSAVPPWASSDACRVSASTTSSSPTGRRLHDADRRRARGGIRRRERGRQYTSALYRDVRLLQRHHDAGSQRRVRRTRRLRALRTLSDPSCRQCNGHRFAPRHAGRLRPGLPKAT